MISKQALRPNELPPVNAFWSLTLYDLPSSLLYENPLERYLINSPMLPKLKRDPDGGLTLYVQHQSPGPERESNWLPAPAGPFWMILRLYWPKPAAVSGAWEQPPLMPMPLAGEPSRSLKVSPQTYIRAETDRSFHNIVTMAGGINRFFHFRNPTPLDKQTVVRMNRDTLYSAAIIDTSKGATVTLPKVEKGRYVSALIIDNDHYSPAVFDKPGVHKIPRDTKYVLVAVRIQLFNPKDPAELAYVNRLQDQLVIHANSAEAMPPNNWDQASLQALTKEYELLSKKYDSWKGMMGQRGKVDEAERHIAAAAAWGLNPDTEATYLSYSGQHETGQCYSATYKEPDARAFWSITVYGADGYMTNENNLLNSSNVKLNRDGTFTVYFGTKDLCGDVPNRLDVTQGWNFLMRAYRPGPSMLNGDYILPAAHPIQ